MERRQNLRRKTPLKSKARLSGSGLGRRTPIRSRSAKTKADMPRRKEVRDEVFARDGYRCLLAGRHRCYGALTVHHLLKSGQGGSYEEPNLVSLCASANSWVEDEPDAAYALGLVVRRGESIEDAHAAMQRAGLRVPR